MEINILRRHDETIFIGSKKRTAADDLLIFFMQLFLHSYNSECIVP
jgi:hypothetical protein